MSAVLSEDQGRFADVRRIRRERHRLRVYSADSGDADCADGDVQREVFLHAGQHTANVGGNRHAAQSRDGTRHRQVPGVCNGRMHGHDYSAGRH